MAGEGRQSCFDTSLTAILGFLTFGSMLAFVQRNLSVVRWMPSELQSIQVMLSLWHFQLHPLQSALAWSVNHRV